MLAPTGERGIVVPPEEERMARTAAFSVIAGCVLVGGGCNEVDTSARSPTAVSASPAVGSSPAAGFAVETLRRGTGDEARAGDDVRVHYVGTLADGRKFESSRERGEPYGFRLGVGRVLAGWDRGIEGMRVGEVRRLTVPPSMGYGGSAVGAIPPNATLVFEVELVDVRRGG
jgi:FKBP-type peptidyl-prolyl cis-trans isomerase